MGHNQTYPEIDNVPVPYKVYCLIEFKIICLPLCWLILLSTINQVNYTKIVPTWIIPPKSFVTDKKLTSGISRSKFCYYTLFQAE
jgi:hypothetical protein